MPAHPRPLTLFATCGAWYLPHTAYAFSTRGALAELWASDRCRTPVPQEKVRRCWPFHLAMWPLYHTAPQIWVERALYAFFPIWKAWVRTRAWPKSNVVHAIMGYASEVFDRADRTNALKVLDCPNSHPVSFYGYWQRECDLWCAGEKVPIPRWMFARMTRELERADVVLCPSSFVRDTMITNGLAPEKLFVNPFGADTNIFTPRTQPPTAPRFISVGTICLRKGYQYLFRAFEKVQQRHPQAELICVGEYKTDFRHERRRWEGRFTHIPHLSHENLAQLLRTCSAFVLGSVEEGFARVLAEAMAAGLPIIATSESGAPTLVRDGEEGYIVPARRIDLLADAMNRAIINPADNQRLGEAAYSRGGALNSWQDYGDRLLEEYEHRLQLRSSREEAWISPATL